MKAVSRPASALVPADQNLPSSFRSQLPQIIVQGGKAAVFAAEEFFFGRIRNANTRAAYMIAVKRVDGLGRVGWFAMHAVNRMRRRAR